MECVINDDIAMKLAKGGHFYIHNRFHKNIVGFSKKMISAGLPLSISVGVNDSDCELLEDLYDQYLNPNILTIDIAHGHSVNMEKMLKWIRMNFMNPPFIIAGNVSTPEAVRDLEAWGANCIKVGIGPGSACTTYEATGFGSRGIQASVLAECAAAKTKPSTMIMADGGIRNPGDIAKCLVLGADVVMIGGMFSGLVDSPGEVVRHMDGHLYKEFWGSASAFQSGKKNRIEGTKKLIPYRGHSLLEELQYIKESLQSAISYGGGTDLSCFKEVKYIV
jgi:GMP reductase